MTEKEGFTLAIRCGGFWFLLQAFARLVGDVVIIFQNEGSQAQWLETFIPSLQATAIYAAVGTLLLRMPRQIANALYKND